MNKSILLVDDEKLILVGWKFALESAGYQVETALTGTDAVKKAEEKRPDLVITDLFLPDINGVEICKSIKTMYTDCSVILISGDPFELEKIQKDFIKAGGKDWYLQKPLSIKEMLESVERILK